MLIGPKPDMRTPSAEFTTTLRIHKGETAFFLVYFCFGLILRDFILSTSELIAFPA